MSPFLHQKFHEMVFQLLFSLDMGNTEEEDLVPFLMAELAVSRKKVKEALEKALAVWEKRTDFDAAISKVSREYAFDRIQRVERNILRLALYEIIVEKELEEKMIISEAIRLSRKFSTPESVSFINAILDEYTVSSRNQPTPA